MSSFQEELTTSAVLGWRKNLAVVWATGDTDSVIFSVVSNSTSVHAKMTPGIIQHLGSKKMVFHSISVFLLGHL